MRPGADDRKRRHAPVTRRSSPAEGHRPPRRRRRLVGAAVACAGLLLVAIVALYCAPLPAPPPPRPLPESTKILDRDGRVLYDTAGQDDAHYTSVPLAQVPLALRQAVIATEDASFYDNPGISIRGVVRAAISDIRHGAPQSGGSTITQQLARNLYFDQQERSSSSPLRKLREAELALRLERSTSKDGILEQYLNRVYFGNLAYGVEAASRTYFGKSARDLDLAESALIAGLLQSPADYDPLTKFDAATTRQGQVLGRMVDAGYITRTQADAAHTEPLTLNPTPFSIEAPHFVARVRDQLPSLIGVDAVAAGGLRVYTALDAGLQRTAQDAVAWQVKQLKDHNVGDGAVVVIDPHTGDLLAMVGSADYFDAAHGGAFNAALAERQPGSSIKPVIYAAALESGYTPTTPLLDIPTTLQTKRGEAYSPNNYDNTFHGMVPLRDALASSYNVPAVRTLAAVGLDRAFEMGRRLGLTSFRDPSRYDLSLALGGGEVRLLDLTAAYAALAAGGTRVEPVAVTRVEDARGNLLYVAPEQRRERAVSPQTAYLLSDILSDNDARTPGFGPDSALRIENVAAKTGTTTDFRDNWTLGYSRDLAVGVWMGNADNTPMRDISGIDGAAPVWREVMLAGLASRPAAPFDVPDGIQRVTVCLPSGLLPTPECQRSRVEVFAEGTAPTAEDDYYRSVPICDATGALASDACSGGVHQRTFAFVPPEAIPWARSAGVDLPPVPPYVAGPAPVGYAATSSAAPLPQSGKLLLVSPADGASLHLSRELRAEDQVIRVEAQPSSSVRYVELFVDGELLAHVEAPPYRGTWQLAEGAHDVRARAVAFDGSEIWSETARITVWRP